MKKRLRCWLGLSALMLLPVLGMQQAMAQAVCGNTRSTSGAYTHENWLYSSNGSQVGTGCITLGDGGTFSAEWSGIYNFLGRRGLGYNEDQRHQDLGWFKADYTVDYRPDCSRERSNSYMGLYGWTFDDQKDDSTGDNLVEWYILEGWCNWNPSVATTPIATINVRGKAMYDVVESFRDGWPSIKNGTTDKFKQYFSVKRNSNTNGDAVTLTGTVDVSEHFHQWEILGMDMGNLYEVTMLVEGYGEGMSQSPDTPTGYGTADFSVLSVSKADSGPSTVGQINFGGYNVYPNTGGTAQLAVSAQDLPEGADFPELTIAVKDGDTDTSGPEGANNPDHMDIIIGGDGKTYWFLTPLNGKTSTVNVYVSMGGVLQDSMQVTVGPNVAAGIYPKTSAPAMRRVQLRALGTSGAEKIALTLNGATQRTFNLTNSFKTYSSTIVGNGEVAVQFTNDADGRDVRLDYLEVDGVRRETEAMADNSAAFANGVCGGGTFTEWLHCNGAVYYGEVGNDHTITVRARGNRGGEHINLLINGSAVNGGWSLGTNYQTYAAVVKGNGDINVQFDNDGGLRDVIIDWVKVDDQNPRQAENMQYNTGNFANGRCGGAGYSQWMHCNGVIGFGNISDNFN